MEIDIINVEDDQINKLQIATDAIKDDSANTAWASLRKSRSNNATEWINPKLFQSDIVEDSTKNFIESEIEIISSNIKDLKKDQEGLYLFQGAIKSLSTKVTDSIKEIETTKVTLLDNLQNYKQLNTTHNDLILSQTKEIDSQIKKLTRLEIESLIKIDEKISSIDQSRYDNQLESLEISLENINKKSLDIIEKSGKNLEASIKTYDLINDLIEISSLTNNILKENFSSQKELEEKNSKKERNYLIFQTSFLALIIIISQVLVFIFKN